MIDADALHRAVPHQDRFTVIELGDQIRRGPEEGVARKALSPLNTLQQEAPLSPGSLEIRRHRCLEVGQNCAVHRHHVPRTAIADDKVARWRIHSTPSYRRGNKKPPSHQGTEVRGATPLGRSCDPLFTDTGLPPTTAEG